MKPRPKITRRPHGPTTISFPDTGTSFDVPAPIDIEVQDKSFGPSVVSMVKHVYDRSERRLMSVMMAERTGDTYKLVTALHNGSLYWSLIHDASDERFAAAGYLKFMNDADGYRFYATGAYAKPGHGGLGLYPKVLRALKKSFRVAIFSDKTLSPWAAAMYARNGRFSPKHGRYRINPAPKRAPSGHSPRFLRSLYRSAIAFSCSEEGMGDRVPGRL